jgi:hypothetical protein
MRYQRDVIHIGFELELINAMLKDAGNDTINEIG